MESGDISVHSHGGAESSQGITHFLLRLPAAAGAEAAAVAAGVAGAEATAEAGAAAAGVAAAEAGGAGTAAAEAAVRTGGAVPTATGVSRRLVGRRCFQPAIRERLLKIATGYGVMCCVEPVDVCVSLTLPVGCINTNCNHAQQCVTGFKTT